MRKQTCGIWRRFSNVKSGKPAPHFFKFSSKGPYDFGVVGHDDVLVVLGGGGTGPVVAAAEQEIVVGDGELVVHVGGGAIKATIDSCADEVVEVGSQIHGFVVVRDDADGNAPAQGLFKSPNYAIISDGEDADIQGLLTFPNESPDAVEAIIARTKVGGGLDFVLARVDEFDHALQPIERGDLAELVDGTLCQVEGELPGFGLLGVVAADPGEVGF